MAPKPPQVIRVVTRISPVNDLLGGLSALVKPAVFGNPFKVERCRAVDPRTGTEFAVETFFCFGKLEPGGGDIHREIASECQRVPGLVSASGLEGTLGRDAPGGHFAISIPKVITQEKIREVLDAPDKKPKAGIKIHIDLKKIRESSAPARRVPKKVALLKPLLRYFVQDECLICGEIIAGASKHRIHRHMASHVAQRGYLCRCCEAATFPTVSALYSHVLKRGGPAEYRCDLCGEAFQRRYLLAVHRQAAHSPVLQSKRGFLLKEKVPTCFSCSACSKNFASWKAVASHRGAHAGEAESYLCLLCGKSFSNTCLLRYHSHLRAVSRCHSCGLCDKAFPTLVKLLKHRKVSHAKQSQHPCRVCGKKFNFPSSLQKHVERLHPGA